MLVEIATVVHYENGIAQVQCSAKSACGSCAAQKGCGTKALSAQFELAVNEPLKPGDRIELGLSETTLLNGVMWIYGVPLLVLILSAIIFSTVFKNELAVASCMLISTACAFWGVKKRINHKQQANLMPVFLGKVS